MPRYKLLGINVDSIEAEDLYKKLFSLSLLKKPSQIILLDTYLIMKAQFNKDLLKTINSAEIVIPISYGIYAGLRFFNYKIEKIYNYFQFLITLLLKFTEEKKFIYFLGGKKNDLEKLERNIRDSFPGIRLVGKFYSEYKKSVENDLVTAIKKASPSLILIGKKSPKQEKWIKKNINKFNSGIFIGVGNFFDIVAGKAKAPSDKLVKSPLSGFESFLKKPMHIFRIFYYLLFIIFLLLYKIFKNK